MNSKAYFYSLRFSDQHCMANKYRRNRQKKPASRSFDSLFSLFCRQQVRNWTIDWALSSCLSYLTCLCRGPGWGFQNVNVSPRCRLLPLDSRHESCRYHRLFHRAVSLSDDHLISLSSMLILCSDQVSSQSGPYSPYPNAPEPILAGIRT